jgi:hypothetical protein
VGGIEAIPAMISILGLPKTIWLLLVLFIIIVVWARSIWKAKKKNNNLVFNRARFGSPSN